MQVQAGVLVAADLLEQSADAGDAHRGWIGTGQKCRVQRLRGEQGAGANEAFPAEYRVDQCQVVALVFYFNTYEFLLRGDLIDSNAPGGDQPGRGSGDGSLKQRREHVVGAGGQGQKGRIRPADGEGAIGAVAAEGDGHGAGHVLQRPGGGNGVERRSGAGGVQGLGFEAVDLAAASLAAVGLAAALVLERAGNDAVRIVEIGEFPGAGGNGAGQYAAHDGAFFLVVEYRRPGDETAHVLSGRRIGDHAQHSHESACRARGGF